GQLGVGAVPDDGDRRPPHRRLLPAHDVRHDARLRDVLRAAGVDRREARQRARDDRLVDRRARRHLLPVHEGRGVHDPAPREVDRPALDRLGARRREDRLRPAQPVGRHAHRGRGTDRLQVQHRGEVVPLRRPAELPRRPGLPAARVHRPRLGRVDVRRRAPAEPPAPELDLAVEATSRCLAGKAYVAVRATNGEDVPVTVTLATPYGEETVADVAPGTNAYQSFAALATAVPAGTVAVTGVATID